MKINIELNENKYIKSYNTTIATFDNNIEVVVPPEYIDTVMEDGIFYGEGGTVIHMQMPVEKLKKEFTENFDCFKYEDGILSLDISKVQAKEIQRKKEVDDKIKAQIVTLTKEKQIYIENEWDVSEIENKINELKKQLI